MSGVSIVIAARNEKYLPKTVNDILAKAHGDIELIVVLDGYWPTEYSKDPRVNYIHFTNPRGMRQALNSAVALARKEYLMKSDAHCMFADGFDEVLKKDCKDNWVVVPRRYPLEPEKWVIEERTDDKYPIDYMILSDTLQGIPHKKENDKKIDDLMTSQGSCWFMKRAYFKELELLDVKTYGSFFQEMQEIGLKCWLSGGEMKVNKNTWYAHWHKTDGRGYSLPRGEQEETRKMVNRWKTEKMFSKQIHNLEWLFERFK